MIEWGLKKRLEDKIRELETEVQNLKKLNSEIHTLYLHTSITLNALLGGEGHQTHEEFDKVPSYAEAIARELLLSPLQIRTIKLAAQLRDIGIIGINDLLRKKGKLTSGEWAIIKYHPVKGANIVSGLKFLDGVAPIVHSHHEKYDGSGYPAKLKGEDIPLGAHIIAVADAFNAMVSERPYRPAFTRKEAIAELERNRNNQFHPGAVKAFLKILKSSSENNS